MPEVSRFYGIIIKGGAIIWNFIQLNILNH